MLCKTCLIVVQACFQKIGTVNSQRGRVSGIASSIRGDASILARVSCSHRLDAQCAHVSIDLRYRDI